MLFLGDSGFLQFFRVVSSDYGKPRNSSSKTSWNYPPATRMPVTTGCICIFWLGNPKLNLYLPMQSMVRGRSKSYWKFQSVQNVSPRPSPHEFTAIRCHRELTVLSARQGKGMSWESKGPNDSNATAPQEIAGLIKELLRDHGGQYTPEN